MAKDRVVLGVGDLEFETAAGSAGSWHLLLRGWGCHTAIPFGILGDVEHPQPYA